MPRPPPRPPPEGADLEADKAVRDEFMGQPIKDGGSFAMADPGTDSRVRLQAKRFLFRVATLLGVLGAVMLVATPLSAQAISGILVEAETGAPVKGASIFLLNRSGERLDWRLTNADGRFGFQTPGPGTYLLQADRIGHARVLSDPIPIDRGVTVVYTLETPLEPVRLDGIEVGSSRRCEVRPGPGR